MWFFFLFQANTLTLKCLFESYLGLPVYMKVNLGAGNLNSINILLFLYFLTEKLTLIK